MRSRILLALLTSLLIGFINLPAGLASAGYYPTYRGEELRIEACIPAGTNFPLKLQIASTDATWRTVSSVTLNKKIKGNCDKGFSKVKHLWRVNVQKGGSLRLWDSTKKKSFFVWPDGIEITLKNR
jgi:hypothetical protein